jgi:hypothetical protein
MFYPEFLQYARSARSDGARGEACEMAARSFTSGRIVKAVKPAGKVDAYFTWRDADGKKHSASVEYKTACGRIDNIDSQYVAYWAEPVDDVAVEDGFVVFSRDEWNAFLDGYTGRGKLTVERNGEIHIQSFRGIMTDARPKASLPIANYIYDACEAQPTLAEWVEEMRGA